MIALFYAILVSWSIFLVNKKPAAFDSLKRYPSLVSVSWILSGLVAGTFPFFIGVFTLQRAIFVPVLSVIPIALLLQACSDFAINTRGSNVLQKKTMRYTIWFLLALELLIFLIGLFFALMKDISDEKLLLVAIVFIPLLINFTFAEIALRTKGQTEVTREKS